MNFEPGNNFIRILPPKNMKWDYPYYRLVPKEEAEKVRALSHDPDRWKSCYGCVHDAVSGIVAFIEFVRRG